MTYTEVDGSRRVASLDRELFDEVACRQVAALNEARGGLKERAAKVLFARVHLGNSPGRVRDTCRGGDRRWRSRLTRC